MKNTRVFFANRWAKLRSVSRHILWAAAISAVLLAIILTLVWNTSQLNSVLRRSTEGYVQDVSNQLASDLSARLTTNSLYIEQLADSLGKMPGFLVNEEYLDRKAAALGFDQILILQPDGTVLPADFYCTYFDEWRKESAGYYDKSRVTYIAGHKMLFSCPILRDGTPDRLLIGIYENQRIQQLLQSIGFDGDGLSCITDAAGKIVVAPTDAEQFLRIEDILRQGTGKKEIAAIHKMVTDIQNHHAGLLYFTSAQKQPLMMSYHFLNINDWVLLTIVPQDLIVEGSEAYIRRTFLTIGGTAVVFLILLAYIVRSGKKNRAELASIAFTDPLTGGINQASFQIKCKQLLEHQPPPAYSIVFMNIKGFKHINENFGTETGNQTLRYIHNVLVQHMGKNELAARCETDHFYLCLHENTEAAIRARLQDITAAIDRFGRRESVQYAINWELGAYIVDDPGLDIKIILGRARAAGGYQRAEEGCSFYNRELTAKIRREVELNALFEESIRQHHFQVYLQPKVRLAGGTLAGAEALVRWIHPERGMIYPSDFIPLFESNGKICALDLYMFEEVCKLLRRWADEGKPLIPISVNLSRIHMRNLGFLQDFVAIKEKYQIPDGVIEFELLESVAFDTPQIKLVQNVIQDMHRHGFLCSLDDFGFGYSSLALLKEFDVDTIKLDRQFFADSLNQKSWKVIASFVALAKELGISVVAEGIETAEQLAILGAINCEMVQGYVYAKPLPVADFENWARTFAHTAI